MKVVGYFVQWEVIEIVRVQTELIVEPFHFLFYHRRVKYLLIQYQPVHHIHLFPFFIYLGLLLSFLEIYGRRKTYLKIPEPNSASSEVGLWRPLASLDTTAKVSATTEGSSFLVSG